MILYVVLPIVGLVGIIGSIAHFDCKKKIRNFGVENKMGGEIFSDMNAGFQGVYFCNPQSKEWDIAVVYRGYSKTDNKGTVMTVVWSLRHFRKMVYMWWDNTYLK